MTKDLNKGISNIQYNSLNLPTQLTINGTVNNYTYTADGTKLRVTHGSDVTDYVGNKIYENGSLKRILIDGGYIENGVYHFYLNDHLGNNRVVATGTGTVVQKNHYYPFGMTFGEIVSSEQDKQPYQYNGKELDRKNGLNLYDYSARYMEPSLGRFTTMDPHAESYYAWSPYHYAGNNPVRITDPTGMDWYMNDKTGELYFSKECSDVNITYKDQSYNRIGGNDMLNDMGEILEKSYNTEASFVIAKENGLEIVPTQQLIVEETKTQSMSTGKRNVNITNGKITKINEKYDIVPANSKQIVAKNQILEENTDQNIVTNLSGGKTKYIAYRSYYKYNPPATGIKGLLNSIFEMGSAVLGGQHDYRNIVEYNSWKHYGHGILNIYKQ